LTVVLVEAVPLRMTRTSSSASPSKSWSMYSRACGICVGEVLALVSSVCQNAKPTVRRLMSAA
jgi:hypothetical protein